MGSVLVSAMTLPTPALSRNYVENPDIINFYSSYACLPHFNLMFLPELFIFPEAFRNKDSTDTFVIFSYSFILLRPSCLLPSLSLSPSCQYTSDAHTCTFCKLALSIDTLTAIRMYTFLPVRLCTYFAFRHL